MLYHMTTPLNRELLKRLRAGDRVLLSGQIYTARDAAHQRMAACIEQGEPLPFALQNECIYYAGPTPAPPGHVVGAIGPTTAGRVDSHTPLLLRQGLAGMIGKGVRSDEVKEAMQACGAVYFGFVGGAGALAAARITACEMVAWEDLGSEAVRRLTVTDFPLTVLMDTDGNDLYTQGRLAYLRTVR